MAVSPFLSRVSARWVEPPTTIHRMLPIPTLFGYTSALTGRGNEQQRILVRLIVRIQPHRAIIADAHRCVRARM
jgi:hypothetical protein